MTTVPSSPRDSFRRSGPGSPSSRAIGPGRSPLPGSSMNSGDYALAQSYGQLFTANGDPTSEDIFRVLFNETDQNYARVLLPVRWRFEIGATQDIYDAVFRR